MERKIKILYTITICAIIAFLGMQAYWIHSRYEYALDEYAATLEGRILTAIDLYRDARWTEYNRHAHIDTMQRSSFSIEQAYGDTVTTRRTATINTYVSNIRDILGLAPDDSITEEHRMKIVDMEIEKITSPVSARIFDASSAPDENAAWIAAKNVQLESRVPFAVEGIDSVLRHSDIEGTVSLVGTDSMIWANSAALARSFLHPGLTVTVPYSQLECKSVEIACPFSPSDVLPGMAPTLICIGALSLLLILCLVWQSSVILRLNRLDKTRNDFVSTMIHELKRPISTLKMCVSGMQNDNMMARPGVKDEILAETRSALDVLSAYFSRMRDITFNNSAQIPLSITRFPLGALIAERGARISTDARKTVRFNNLCPTDIGLSADRTHFANILDNLLENAVKYSGDSVEITVSAIASDCNTVITVEDNGPGMSDTDCRKAFDRFYRSPDAASKPGMGLGLTYVRLLVEAHNGTVAVESRQGHGTRFTITIPQ